MTDDATIWVSVSSHRARDRLKRTVTNCGASYGIWPEGEWPRGEYYEVPAGHRDALARIKGLRVLAKPPATRRLFVRFFDGPQSGNWPVPPKTP